MTIIIVNFNGTHYLDKTFPAWSKFGKVIVADAKSDIPPNYPHITGPVRGGKNQVVNLAVSQVKADYICVVDNDLLPPSDLDFNALEQLVAQDNIVTIPAFKPNCAKTKQYGRNFGITFLQPQKSRTFKEIQQITHTDMFYGIFFMKRKTFLELGGFNTVIPFGCDDNDFSLKYSKKHHKRILLYTASFLIDLGGENRATKARALGWWHHVFAAHWCIQHYFNYKIISHIITAGYLFVNAVYNAVYYKRIEYLAAYFLGYYKLLSIKHEISK